MRNLKEIEDELRRPFAIPAILGAEQQAKAYISILTHIKEILEEPQIDANYNLGEKSRDLGIEQALRFLLNEN